MTRSSSTTVCHQSGSPQPGRASSTTRDGPSRASIWDGTDPSPLCVVEPEIPEGMTCAEWLRRRQPSPKTGSARARRCVAAPAAGRGSAVVSRVRSRRCIPLPLTVHGVRTLGGLSGPNSAIESRRM